MSGARAHVFYAIVASTLLALDLWSKEFAVDRLRGEDPGVESYSVIDDVLEFRLVYNPGMMWGMAQNVPARWWVAIRGGVLLALFWLYFTTERRSALSQIAFALVTAGALGNIYDNVFFVPPNGGPAGQVRDFIHFYWFEFPTFNVADSCICVGAPLMLCVLWNLDREKSRSDAEESRAAS